MPVTEESARTMRDIVTRNPGFTLDEAAFLASNKITGDPNLIRAALAMMSGGEKTAEMIAKLISSLGEQVPALGDSQSNNTQTITSEQNPQPGNQGFPSVNAANASPLTELLTIIIRNASGLLQASTQGGQTASQATETIITHPDGNMQINGENGVENLLQHVKSDGSPGTSGAQGNGSPVPITQEAGPNVPQTSGTVPQGEAPGPSSTSTAAGGPVAATAGNAENAAVADRAAAGAAQSAPDTGALPQGATSTPAAPPLGSVVASLLSQIPEFGGTPPSALERFSEMLLRVVSGAGGALDGSETAKDLEMLSAQLNKLFTRIGRNDADAGARLREAREELFARLALIEEAISRAAQPARAEMLQQTQKLMDHVRLLNSIDQFVYMQLPVQLSEQRKTAELYIFKRKGGKRADPDNVNILLSIDLENMGHWEALLNIKGKDVSINMEVAGEAEKEHFCDNTVMLHEMLSQEGYKLVSTNIKLYEKETTPLTALTAFDRYTGGRQTMIDFMI